MNITSPVTIARLSDKTARRLQTFFERHALKIIIAVFSLLSVCMFYVYLSNGLGLAYNDARSHLDIGRRVVEGLKPGLAQLGSVWLPLNHLLMVPLIWNDWMWHSGFAGAVQSMAGFVVTAVVIYKLLELINIGWFGRIAALFVFAANINVLYLQSTAMSELPLIASMTIAVYELIKWHKTDDILALVRSAFWIMLATLIRYDGWFLLGQSGLLIMIHAWRRGRYRSMEGMAILFATLAAFGIVLWLLWNLLIFKDPLYFALGPFSAHAQQEQLKTAGNLYTYHNLPLSIMTYIYAMLYNSYTLPMLIAGIGAIVFWFDRKQPAPVRLASTALFSPLFFNIIALYLGFSVLFVQRVVGDTWFNVRYGIMLAPTMAIFVGYLVERLAKLRWVIVGGIIFVLVFAIGNNDAVTLDDATVGSSQKNVSEVSGYLAKNARKENGFILISAASHDAIIFSSGLPMIRFIHEGTGAYWESATTGPEHWARWIVMRTHDNNDLVWKAVSKTRGLEYYDKVASYPFADVYKLQATRSGTLQTEPTLGKQK